MTQDKPQISFVPLHNYVIVKPFTQKEMDDIELKKKSTIYVPTESKKGKTNWGTVYAVGPGKLDLNGLRIPIAVSVGDVVIFSEYDMSELVVDGEDYFCIRDEFIFSKYNK